MRTSRTSLALMTGVAAGGLLLGACGGSSGNGEEAKPASQILRDAQQATTSASSVRISGNLTTNGTHIGLDIVDGHGRGGGTIELSGLTFRVVLHGQDVYLKADSATWTKAANAAAAQLLANRWIRTTTSNPDFSDLAKLLDISQLVTNLKPSGSLTRQAVTVIDGVSVVPVRDTGANQGTLYVATNGAPYMIAVGGGGGNQGRIRFDGYDSATVPAVPTGAIDLSSLEKAGQS